MRVASAVCSQRDSKCKRGIAFFKYGAVRANALFVNTLTKSYALTPHHLFCMLKKIVEVLSVYVVCHC